MTMPEPTRRPALAGKPFTVRKRLRPTERLPEGAVDLCIGVGRDGKPRVYSVAISIPGRGNRVHRTHAFGDGSVVLEFDAHDRLLGLELLSEPPPPAVKAWFRGPRGRKDTELQIAAFHTAHHIRHDLYYALKVLLAAKVTRSRAVETSTSEACPTTKTWDITSEPVTS
jgi:hypothetical protein